jgi:hypothetical protein
LAFICRSPAGEAIGFATDIRPILSDHCFQCHGPDEATRAAGLRLDVAEEASHVLEAGDASASELFRRLTSEDPSQRMPPPDAAKQLKPGEIERIRTWIEQGARYEQHWSFQPIAAPPLPEVARTDWPINAIDHFVLSRLEQAGLSPADEAEPRTLLRRVTLDLTGLPPSPEQVEAFVRRPDLAATIDRLMHSPRYGEHMAWRWLDAARYADSDGYESDPLRHMWPWRDWVVGAFNRHLPYDQFVIEQIAGDELEDASIDQVLATGFNRNHRLNNEGGVDPAEWLVEYVCDRAETTATVFMGLTWQCARCHDHKYDPITSKDYYQLFSFFHQLPERGNGRGASNAPPMLEVSHWTQLDELEAVQAELEPLQSELSALREAEGFESAFQDWRDSLAGEPSAVKGLPKGLQDTPADQWKRKQIRQARDHYLNRAHPPAQPLRRRMRPLEKRLRALKASGAKVMVMGDREQPRETFVLTRGAFDQPAEQVFADTPSFLPPMDADLPKNRLGLARWLVDPQHPLTARVAVNRTWARFFGTGLVKTAEDFGSQGELPSHPQLLDHLARWLIDHDWDLQALQKLILTSATYRQSSAVTPDKLESDPENRLLCRGPRYRLPASVIRDQALAASGLLVEQIGGPPVKPYQPPGLWKEIIKGRVEYRRDRGEKLYRRSLYTLWRRAVKPPLMTLLDANGRDTCAVDLKRTNTPLQALLLLNDVTFVEHARALAARMIRESDGSDRGRIERGMRLLLARAPSEREAAILRDELERQRAFFRQQPDQAEALLRVGDWQPAATVSDVEWAATTCVARVLLNLDETLTKE